MKNLVCVLALYLVVCLCGSAKACDQFGVSAFGGSCGSFQSFGVVNGFNTFVAPTTTFVPVQTFAVNAFGVHPFAVNNGVFRQNTVVRQRGVRPLFAPRQRTVIRQSTVF